MALPMYLLFCTFNKLPHSTYCRMDVPITISIDRVLPEVTVELKSESNMSDRKSKIGMA